MTIQQRIDTWKIHDSMRGHFAFELYKAMAKYPSIFIVTADLGYGMFDFHREDFPDQFINVGASEFAGCGIACGLAMSGKIPFFYSITTFLLYRSFEMIRNYVDHDKIPVKLCGGGRDFDYKEDGWSHHSPDAKKALECFPNIVQFWPDTNEEMEKNVKEMIDNDKPSFISLKR